MAGVDRMTIEQVVRKVLMDDRAHVIRESVQFVAEQLMESEVSDLVGAELGERGTEPRSRSPEFVPNREGGVFSCYLKGA